MHLMPKDPYKFTDKKRHHEKKDENTQFKAKKEASYPINLIWWWLFRINFVTKHNCVCADKGMKTGAREGD